MKNLQQTSRLPVPSASTGAGRDEPTSASTKKAAEFNPSRTNQSSAGASKHRRVLGKRRRWSLVAGGERSPSPGPPALRQVTLPLRAQPELRAVSGRVGMLALECARTSRAPAPARAPARASVVSLPSELAPPSPRASRRLGLNIWETRRTLSSSALRSLARSHSSRLVSRSRALEPPTPPKETQDEGTR